MLIPFDVQRMLARVQFVIVNVLVEPTMGRNLEAKKMTVAQTHTHTHTSFHWLSRLFMINSSGSFRVPSSLNA